MKKFFFSFGIGHANGNRYQVIFARTEEEAYAKMFELHGNQWAFGNSHEQWQRSKAEGFFQDLRPLKNAFAFAS